jgi:transglutaminase-like putative cysteine protease
MVGAPAAALALALAFALALGVLGAPSAAALALGAAGAEATPGPQALAVAFGDTGDDLAAMAGDFNLLGALKLLYGDSGLGGAARPGDLVSRAEFCAIVLRLRGLEAEAARLAGQRPAFADGASIPTWAWGYVNAARLHGIIRGYEDGTFRAADTVRLAEALVMLLTLLDRQDEVLPGLGWPESYLELGDRTGVAGSLSGYGHIELDRASSVHLAANALAADLGHHGSGQSILQQRFGRIVATVTAASGTSVTTREAGTLLLAGQYVHNGIPPAALVGSKAELLRLPGGRVAWLAPAGAAGWSRAPATPYLSDRVGARPATLGSWWRAYLADEAAWAAARTTPQAGSLRTGSVQLSLPQTAGNAVGFGFLRLRGTTNQQRLQVRLAAGHPWTEIRVEGGRFDQRVFFPSGRGAYDLRFLTPVPGREGYWSEDLGFLATNQLTAPHDQSSGLTLLWPRASLVEAADGYVDVVAAGIGGPGAGHDHVVVRVSKDGAAQMWRVPAVGGEISVRIHLTRGPGEYEVRLCLPAAEEGFYRLSDVSFGVRAAAGVDEALAPGVYIESGRQAVHELALSVVGTAAGDYERARAIYRWLGRNLTYDLARAKDPAARPLATTEILELRRGVCQDFSNVFAAMCRSLGIPCRVVHGQAPPVGGTPHAWNEFWAGGRWVLVDATWGSGYIRDGQVVTAPTDDWFDRDLSATHGREAVASDWR